MDSRFRSAPVPGLQENAGVARLAFGYSTVTEIAELFRALAVACLERQIERVLIVAGDDEPAGERALRDALTVMLLAGLPPDFRLALVAATPRVAHTYRHAPRDFSAAGVSSRLFESEDEAARWLGAPPPREAFSSCRINA